MGEPCLRRSLSQPSSSLHISKEEDPLRALRESVSFGRFMTEPLDWEKWSAFSHNRYLEEAELLSKPGSVAQKKAYFEAQLKKKATEQEKTDMTSVDKDIAVFPEIQESGDSKIDKEESEKIPASTIERGNAKASPKAFSGKIASRTKSFVKELINKGNAKSLHMSIQFSSRAGEISKRASPIMPKIRNSVNISASTLKKPALNHNSDDKRETDSVNGRGDKPRPSISSCPFSFKSEERAVKRKEFYEKLEERRKADEAAKKNPQTRYQIASVQPRSRRNPTPNKTRTANHQLCESRKSKSVENEQCKNHSITSHARENTSPNIQKPNRRFK